MSQSARNELSRDQDACSINFQELTVCSSSEQESPSDYSLQKHSRKDHGAKQRKPSNTVPDLNKIVEQEVEDGEELKEELSVSQYFAVDTEIENGIDWVINFHMSKLDTKIINEKLEEVFNKLDSASMLDLLLMLESILILDLFFVKSKR